MRWIRLSLFSVLLYELLFASASLKSCCKGNCLDRLFVSESGLLLCNVLLLELSRSDGLVEFTLSNFVSLLDVVGIGDEAPDRTQRRQRATLNHEEVAEVSNHHAESNS